MTLTVRDLAAVEWPEALRVCARAMRDYRYVRALFGDDPVDRLAGTAAEYLGRPWDPRRRTVGAFAGDLLVGVARGWEHCPVCEEAAEPLEPSDPADGRGGVAAATDAYESARRTAHRGLPVHGHVAPVMVEPVVAGRGIGAAMMDALLQRLDAEAPARLVLECIPELVGFYSRFGFRVAADLLDPLEPGMVVMLRG